MFKRKTLFVVGAGASAEVGFPVGRGLADIIAKRLYTFADTGRLTKSGDDELFRQIRREHPQEFSAYIDAARLIHQGLGLASSIDDFLNIHNANQFVTRIGKAAIASAILDAERKSDLHIDPSNAYNKLDVAKVSNSWFVSFMRILARGPALADIAYAFANISFVTFNYDRSIEHFLEHALQPLYGIDQKTAAEIVSNVEIIHPYGVVGDLNNGTPFGGHPHGPPNYLGLGDRIKTYTEQIQEGTTTERIRKAAMDAEQIVFLGFAYHDQNMKLLQPLKPMGRKRFYGTAFGMSDSDRDVVTDQLFSFVDVLERDAIYKATWIRINNSLTSTQLFNYYAKSLES